METHRSRLEKIAPKKFFCYFDLKKGCTFIGAFLTAAMILCIVATVVQTLGLKRCEGCAYNSWKYAFAYSVCANVYACIMLLTNLSFIWAVRKEKMTIILAWVVISTVLLAQSSCLLIVLITEYGNETGVFSSLFNLICTIIFLLLLAYFVLCGYGYWLQLRDKLPSVEASESPEIQQ